MDKIKLSQAHKFLVRGSTSGMFLGLIKVVETYNMSYYALDFIYIESVDNTFFLVGI